MQISFVGFQPIQSSEHMGALGVFGTSLKDYRALLSQSRVRP
jgi:hypothetical protein